MNRSRRAASAPWSSNTQETESKDTGTRASAFRRIGCGVFEGKWRRIDVVRGLRGGQDLERGDGTGRDVPDR